GTTKFDLGFVISEQADEIRITIEYYSALFKAGTIQRMAGHFNTLIETVIINDSIRLKDIDLLSQEEKYQVLYQFNDTARPFPRHKTIHRLFQEQAQKTPDNVAVEFKETCITYSELNNCADSLARRLSRSAAQRVGVRMSRPLERTIALLGILKAGAAYIPFDPSLPVNRIRYMINDAAISTVVADEEFTETLESLMPECPCLTGIIASGGPSGPPTRGGKGPKGDAIPTWRGLWKPIGPSDSELETSPEPAFDNTVHIESRDLLAYILYTSGSTGNSKGVMVDHHSILRLVINTNYVQLNHETRILQTGSPAFDATTFEIWGSLLNGGQLILVDKDDILDAQLLGPALLKKRVNTIFFSAPLFHRLVAQNVQIFAHLTHILVGGDVLAPTFANRVRQAHPHLHLSNAYGPTENTTFTSCYLVDQDFDCPIPIGTPIANTQVLILDTDGHPQPIGVYGELCCAGEGVARGYLNNPELTAEKFVSVASGGPPRGMGVPSGGPKGGSLWKPINERLKDIRIPNDTAVQWGSKGSLPLALGES
ncbi:MAG: AMP-binding protein, partial [bacterium]|nr:AMP-binding protein [bacterium]